MLVWARLPARLSPQNEHTGLARKIRPMVSAEKPRDRWKSIS